jgi:hypothetical protein
VAWNAKGLQFGIIAEERRSVLVVRCLVVYVGFALASHETTALLASVEVAEQDALPCLEPPCRLEPLFRLLRLSALLVPRLLVSWCIAYAGRKGGEARL